MWAGLTQSLIHRWDFTVLCHLPACSFRTLQTTPPPPDAERLFICACLLRRQSWRLAHFCERTKLFTPETFPRPASPQTPPLSSSRAAHAMCRLTWTKARAASRRAIWARVGGQKEAMEVWSLSGPSGGSKTSSGGGAELGLMEHWASSSSLQRDRHTRKPADL